jgi:hypothetical protein
MSTPPTPVERQLFASYKLLKNLLPHWPESTKMYKTIKDQIEGIRQVILPDPWKPISDYKGYGEVLVALPDGTIQLAHWASDLSGSDQPPFEGWFEKVFNDSGNILYCRGIETPIAWKDKVVSDDHGQESG